MSDPGLSFEAMRASRPLKDVGWIDDVESAAVEKLGEGILDFHDEDLEARELVLVGTGELAGMQVRTGQLEGISSYEFIRSAKTKVPGSFSREARPNLTGRINLAHMREASGDKQVLTAQVKDEAHLRLERFSVLDAIEQVAKKGLPWRKIRLRIKLATLLDPNAATIEDLFEVAESLPATISVGQGQIEPVKVQVYETAIEQA